MMTFEYGEKLWGEKWREMSLVLTCFSFLLLRKVWSDDDRVLIFRFFEIEIEAFVFELTDRQINTDNLVPYR